MMPTRKSPPKHNGREEEDVKRQQQQGIEHKDKDNARTILAASKSDVAATSARAAKSNTVDDFQKGETRPTAAGSGGNSRKRKLCDFVIDATSGATCQSISQKGGKCRKHGDTCDFVDANTGETRPTAAGSGGNSKKRKLCDFVIDATSGATCQSIAQKGGKCRKHGDTCDFVDASTGVKCTTPAVRGGKCRSHGGRDTCDFVDASTKAKCQSIAQKGGKCRKHGDTCDFVDANTGVKCTKPIKRGGKCCSHGGVDTCDFVDAITKAKCTNLVVRGSKCGAHGGIDTCDFVDAITKAKCTNLVRRDGKCGAHGGRDTCDVVIDATTPVKCPNIAVRDGKCCSHGDAYRCTFLHCSGKQCIREQVKGVGTMCLSCSNQNAECQSSGCVDNVFFGGFCKVHAVNSPSTIVLKHMDNRMKHLKSLMTEEQYKVVTELHALRKMLMHNNMQDRSTSANSIITNLCVDMKNKHLTDMKYQGQSVLDDALKNWLPLELYVHQRLMWSLKCSLRDIRCEHNYGERLSVEKVRQILKAIDLALDNAVQEHGWVVAKLGSGNVDTRAGDNNLYNSAIFDREKIVDLHVDITNNERSSAERFGINYLAGLGISANCQLVENEIPNTSNQVDQNIGLYMMFSRFQSTSVHFAESGILHRGVRLPPGATMIQSSESPPPISEQLNDNQNQESGDELDDSGAFSSEFGDENEGDCGGVDDDDSKTCAESTETDGNEDDSPGNADRTLHSSSSKKDTSKKIKSSRKAETIEDVSAPKSSKETAASSVDFHAKMTDEIDKEDEESSGIVELTGEIDHQQACNSHFKTPDAKRFQPSTTPSGLSFDSSEYTAGDLDVSAMNAMDEQHFGVKNSAFAHPSSLQNSDGKVVTPEPSPADDLFNSTNVSTSTESTAPHGFLPAGVQHPGTMYSGMFLPMAGAIQPGAVFEGMPQWQGVYPAHQPMAAGPVPPCYPPQQMAFLVAQTDYVREQTLALRKNRVTEDFERRISSKARAKHRHDPERFLQIRNSGLIKVYAESEVTDYEDPPPGLSQELVEILDLAVKDERKKE